MGDVLFYVAAYSGILTVFVAATAVQFVLFRRALHSNPETAEERINFVCDMLGSYIGQNNERRLRTWLHETPVSRN